MTKNKQKDNKYKYAICIAKYINFDAVSSREYRLIEYIYRRYRQERQTIHEVYHEEGPTWFICAYPTILPTNQTWSPSLGEAVVEAIEFHTADAAITKLLIERHL